MNTLPTSLTLSHHVSLQAKTSYPTHIATRIAQLEAELVQLAKENAALVARVHELERENAHAATEHGKLAAALEKVEGTGGK